MHIETTYNGNLLHYSFNLHSNSLLSYSAILPVLSSIDSNMQVNPSVSPNDSPSSKHHFTYHGSSSALIADHTNYHSQYHQPNHSSIKPEKLLDMEVSLLHLPSLSRTHWICGWSNHLPLHYQSFLLGMEPHG